MAFQIKDFVSIVASMINWSRASSDKVTDYNVGSVTRTLFEGAAVEMDELYQQTFIGLREAIPVATFRSFRFDKLPAAYARGSVTVTAPQALTQPITLPAGTVFSTLAGLKFLSDSAVTWPAGSSKAQVPVTAEAPGSVYNVEQGAISVCAALGGVYGLSNAALLNGREIETDDEQEQRFADYVSALSRGTVPACEYAARSATLAAVDGALTEYVTRVGSVETAGYVKVYVYGSSGLPSAALLARAQAIINGSRDAVTGAIVPGYRAGGVRVDVLPMVERAIPLSAQVVMQDGYSLTQAAKLALASLYRTSLLSVAAGDTLYLGALETDLLNLEGLRRIVLNGATNITCGANEVLIPGAVEITAL